MNREQFDQEALALSGECHCHNKQRYPAEDQAGDWVVCKEHRTRMYEPPSSVPINGEIIRAYGRLLNITGVTT